MKKIITILILAITLSSCSDDSFKVENPKKETTVEMQQSIDTTNLYTITETEQGNLHIINAETRLIEYKIVNLTGVAKSELMLIMILLILLFASILYRD